MEVADDFSLEAEIEMQEALYGSLYGFPMGDSFYGIDLEGVFHGEASEEAVQRLEIMGESLHSTERVNEFFDCLETGATDDVNEDRSVQVMEEIINGNEGAMPEDLQLLRRNEIMAEGDGNFMAEFFMPVKNATENAAELGGITGICGSTSEPFDPVAHELDATFRLTRYAGLKDLERKVPEMTLSNLLKGLQDQRATDQTVNTFNLFFRVGVDPSVTPIQYGEGQLRLVQTADFFSLLVDDPYFQGRIACANLLSKLYALGVTKCDNVRMLTVLSSKLTDKERNVVLPLLMKGFMDAANEAGANVAGEPTLVDSWITLGGVASSVCETSDILMFDNAVEGDVLLLTKPLGTQLVILLYNCLDDPERWNRMKKCLAEEDIRKAYSRAMNSMTRLNRTAARLMHKYNVHAATDISGAGLLFHAKKLAQKQKEQLSFSIHNLPVIAKVNYMLKVFGSKFLETLHEGLSEETSGGLLICLPRQDAAEYIAEISQIEGFQSAWIVGIAKKGHRTAEVISKPRIVEVPFKETLGKLW